MIQYRDNDNDDWSEMKNPPSTYRAHLKTAAEIWGFSVREVDDTGLVTWEYHPYNVLTDDEIKFRERLTEAAKNFVPISGEAAKLLSDGPEVSGGVDVEPEDDWD